MEHLELTSQKGVRVAYAVRVIKNLRIQMADGITLAADLHMPEAPGFRGPAIIEYTPYHKGNNAAYGPRATRYPFFASQGYVFVNVDIRGTGDSEGFNDSPSSPQEVQDSLAVIRWCAEQPWCDGNVGMIGISYTAGVCYDAARLAPPELKAVVLCQMCSDWYAGMACPGGSLRLFAMENFAPLMAAYNFAPPAPELLGEQWEAVWRQRLDHSKPWSLAYIDNLQDGPFWQSRLLRDQHERVKAATFLIAGWSDWYGDDMLHTYAKLQCPKRVIVGPWTHNYPENAWPLPRMNDRYECLRWFDKYLKGLDTDPAQPLEREPPVVVFVRDYTAPAPLRRTDAGYFRCEPTWPPCAATQSWELGSQGCLSLVEPGNKKPVAAGSDAFVYRPDVGIAAGRYAIGQFTPGWGMADDQRLDEGLSLVYTTPGLDRPAEVIGVPRVRLYYQASASTTFLSVKLCDVAPDGTSVLVSKALLNLTHRDAPAAPSPLVAGQVYHLDLPLQAVAYRFAPGHRVRLMFSGADVLNAWPTPQAYTASLHHGSGRASCLELPLVGPSGLGGPTWRPSEFEPLPQDQIPAPDYEVSRDLIGATLTCSYKTNSGVGVNRSRYTVSLKHPEATSVTSDYTYDMHRPGWHCQVYAKCITESDAHSMRHTAQTLITVNGAAYWQKTWSTSAARVHW